MGEILIANPVLDNFRVVSNGVANLGRGKIGISKEAAEALGVKKGDKVRYVPLISRKTK